MTIRPKSVTITAQDEARTKRAHTPALCPQCGLEISYWLAKGYADPCPRCYSQKTERAMLGTEAQP